MTSKGDQIFQLSLTEIAFILVFILMFLLGSMVFLAHKENEELLAKMTTADNLKERLGELAEAEALLIKEISSHSSADPEEVISQLILESKAITEVARLKKLLEEHQDKITALSEIQQAIENAADGGTDDALMQKQIEDAVILAKTLREKINDQSLITGISEVIEDTKSVGQEASRIIDELMAIQTILADPAMAGVPGTSTIEKIEDMAEKYTAYEKTKESGVNPVILRRENNDLKGQIKFLKNRLEANGGIDFPPCWADENGRIQMLLNVELRDDELDVNRAWPDSREEDARALPNIQAVMSAPVTDYASFLRAVKPISDLSRQQNCRHYVRLKNTIPDAVTSDRRRLSVEGHFYKLEVRR